MNIYKKKEAMIASVYTTMVFSGIKENEATFKADYFVSHFDWVTFMSCAEAHEKGFNWYSIEDTKPILFLTDCKNCFNFSSNSACFDCGDTPETTNFIYVDFG